MTEKRMLIVDAELLKKIDENRGDMSRTEFINFLINSQLHEDGASACPTICRKRRIPGILPGNERPSAPFPGLFYQLWNGTR